MGKNKNKQAKFKPVTIEIQKDEFKKVIENQLKHVQKSNERSVITGVLLKVKQNFLTLVSTDGNTLLETTVTLKETVINEAQIVLSGVYLGKMKLNNAYEFGRKAEYKPFDIMQITIKEDCAVITDVRNQISYSIPAFIGTFPDYQKLIPNTQNKDLLKIGVAPHLLARFTGLTGDRNNPLIFAINPQKLKGAVCIESSNKDNKISYRSLLMPCVWAGFEE